MRTLSKQMGHSASLSELSASDLARFIFCALRVVQERFKEAIRTVDSSVTEDGRVAFLAIAMRSQIECVNIYATLGIGLSIYKISKKTARHEPSTCV